MLIYDLLKLVYMRKVAKSSVRNSDSRSGSGAGSGVAFSKSLPISHSRVGIHHYYYCMVKISSQSRFSESHSRNDSRNGSRSRIFGIGSEKSGLTFQISKPTPDFEKVTPETAPEPTPDPDFSGSGVRIGSDFFLTPDSHSRSRSRFFG